MDIATRQQIGRLLTGRVGPINSMAFSPDGKTLATASGNGLTSGTVRLWDVATHRQLGQLCTVSHLPVYSVAFSPNGEILAAIAVSACGCGMWPPASRSAARSPAPRSESTRWRSARMAKSWLLPTEMAQCGCGTWPPAG